MGILDFPAPLFQLLDNGMIFLPAIVRLILWSVIGGVASMALYALFSPQKRIASVKTELRTSQALLAESDEDFSELITVVKKTLGLSLKHLGLVLGPALLSALPLICIMAWSSTRFGYGLPAPGEPVTIGGRPESSLVAATWQTNDVTTPRLEAGKWIAVWPGDQQTLSLRDANSTPLLEFPLAAPIPQVHKRLWWNSVLGNPAGYLPDEGSVDLVLIDLPPRRYLSIGPDWLGHWLTVFLLASVIAALTTKKVFRIH